MPTFYTDGSCSASHPACLGGIGWVRVLASQSRVLRAYSEPFSYTTTNRMELRAMLSALESLRKPSSVHIISDSLITVNVALKIGTGRYNEVWFNQLKNSDLWCHYLDISKPHQIRLTHVRGHRGNWGNELADKLANGSFQQAKTMDFERIRDNKMDAHGERPSHTLFSAA